MCVVLSNTAVSVIGMDGFLQGAPQPLNSMCTPRYLQMVHVNMREMVVVCHDSRFHLVTRSGSAFELDSIVLGTGQGGIVVRDSYHGHPSLFLVELNGNHIDERNLFAGLPSVEITPHNNCTEHLSLYPLNTDGRFLLWCNTTAGGRVFVVNRLNGEDAPSVELESPPISSPDGRTFAATTGSTLKLYRSDNLGQYPGVKDFGADIILCTYLNSGAVLIVLDGRGQTVVYVETFIDSVGAEGLATLPYASSRSCVHKLITQEVYATSNKTGTLYNVVLFNITSGQALDPVSALLEEPVNIFFQHGTAPDPPPTPDLPPTSQPSPTTTDLTIPPVPTSTRLINTSSAPATSDTPEPSPSPKKLVNSHLYVGVALALLLAIVAMAIVILFKVLISKRQRKCLWGKRVCPRTRPVQETNEEGDTPAEMSSVGGGTHADTSAGGEDMSSGIGTATQSFNNLAPDEDNSSLGSSCRNSQNNFYTEPISETGHS